MIQNYFSDKAAAAVVNDGGGGAPAANEMVIILLHNIKNHRVGYTPQVLSLSKQYRPILIGSTHMCSAQSGTHICTLCNTDPLGGLYTSYLSKGGKNERRSVHTGMSVCIRCKNTAPCGGTNPEAHMLIAICSPLPLSLLVLLRCSSAGHHTYKSFSPKKMTGTKLAPVSRATRTNPFLLARTCGVCVCVCVCARVCGCARAVKNKKRNGFDECRINSN